MAFLKFDDINYMEESELDNTYSNSITTESYFNTTLVTISKLNKEYRDSITEFYSYINENNSTISINSICKNFMSSVSSIIDKFNKCIRDNHSNFISSLKRQMANDKLTIDKNKIVDVRAGNIYNFTLDEEVPKPIGRNIYYDEVEKLQKILKNNSLSQDQKSMELLFTYNALMEELRGEFYDKFRAEILGIKGEVSALEYGDVLFNIYRDGGNRIDTVIEKDEILEIYKRFKNAKYYLNTVERQKDNIIKEYDRIRKDLANVKLSDVASMIGSNVDILDERLQNYIKAKTEQLLNMCSIHTMAYTAKLDAIAALYLQDKSILTAVVNKYSPDEEYVEDIEESYFISNDFFMQSINEYGQFQKATLGFKIKPHKNLEQILKDHKYEGILNLAKTTNKLGDLEYLRKDYQSGKTLFKTLIVRIDKVNKLGLCKETKPYYKSIKKLYIDNGITVKDVEATLKWYEDNYVPVLNQRIKELRKNQK